jgi:hypothetical protein
LRERYLYLAPWLTHHRVHGRAPCFLSPEQLTQVSDRLMGASIRDNILFSHGYDKTFYNLVLDSVYPEDHS